MEIDDLIASLHPLEKKVLPFLQSANNASDLVVKSGMQEVEILRALMWLKNKNALSLTETISENIDLDENGRLYASKKLPERRFLESVTSPKTLPEIKKSASLSDEEASVSIGLLRKKDAIVIDSEKKFSVSEKGKKLVKEIFPEELILKKQFPIAAVSLSANEKILLEDLKKRKILKVVSEKATTFQLTPIGIQLVKKGISSKEYIDALSPGVIKSGSWKGSQFRKYDVKAPVPKIFAGRKQPYRRFIEEVREKFISLGFSEMSGPTVETEFWNMDALFMPQFHSARDIHDAYYVKDPEYASRDELPLNVVENVRKAHENGFKTGSLGWRYPFDMKRTYRHVLRTHDTALSPRTLSSSSLKIPGKYFQIVRCFRYDVIDATHLPDFNQTGGFVVEENLTLRHLVALLRLFAKEFAQADKIKVVPAYFPFTEPSAALYAKHPELGWIELAGAGMFRPEMTAPLGVKAPVIAWGVGLERLAMFKLGLKDIRQLFSHDLEFLRNVRMV